MSVNSKKPKILAVDDVSVVLNAITSALEKHYEVFCLKKAEQVERFLQNTETSPELFILDIEMPGMNGYELINVIRKFEQHKDTPVIMLTGNATVMNFHAAMDAGVADFIAKPVDPKVLLEKVNVRIKT
jgi:DNA-binding response OmpR family regulator